MLRILIADNYKIIRKGIIEVIRETFSTAHIAEVEDAGLLMKKAISEPWDVIIADIEMPGTGVEILQTIKRWRPYLPVLVFSSFPENDDTAPIISAGATAYLNKSCTTEELTKAIKQAAAWLN